MKTTQKNFMKKEYRDKAILLSVVAVCGPVGLMFLTILHFLCNLGLDTYNMIDLSFENEVMIVLFQTWCAMLLTYLVAKPLKDAGLTFNWAVVRVMNI